MAGSSVVETSEQRGPIGVITLTATADDTDGSFPNTVILGKISGRLVTLETDPGSPAPTDNYDIVVNDQSGFDVLQGVGANRDTANTEKVRIIFSGTDTSPPVSNSDVLTLVITGNSVNDAVIIIKIYFDGRLLKAGQ